MRDRYLYRTSRVTYLHRLLREVHVIPGRYEGRTASHFEQRRCVYGIVVLDLFHRELGRANALNPCSEHEEPARRLYGHWEEPLSLSSFFRQQHQSISKAQSWEMVGRRKVLFPRLSNKRWPVGCCRWEGREYKVGRFWNVSFPTGYRETEYLQESGTLWCF